MSASDGVDLHVVHVLVRANWGAAELSVEYGFA
jgi:hypothetical protein